MANSIAIALDRGKIAEMSCIAGVGGDVESLVALAKSGRPIVVLDGCPLTCAARCLNRHGIEPKLHYVLSDFGVKKLLHADFDTEAAKELTEVIAPEVACLQKK